MFLRSRNHTPTRSIPWARFAFFVVAVLFLTACPKNEKPEPGKVTMSSRPVPPVETPPIIAAFNGERAMEHVRKQIEFGPRPVGTAEAVKTRDYIANHLKSSGLAVRNDEFQSSTPQGAKKMTNIIGEISGESREVIIIASHYDTKLYKDMKFVGANDPASSVGTLLEIARVLGANQKPGVTYWIVFFDGEEAFCENWDDCTTPEAPDNTYGSRRFVQQLKEKHELDRVKAMILLDMMGYKNLELGRDDMSTKWLQDIIWKTGKELGHGSVFVDRLEGIGGDDHEPFLDAGIAAVDIIQLNSYPHWHKPTDTIDKVSSTSMKIVGDVVLASLPRIEKRVLQK
jgi:glutaminyl-peptide cyclotransferase